MVHIVSSKPFLERCQAKHRLALGALNKWHQKISRDHCFTRIFQGNKNESAYVKLNKPFGILETIDIIISKETLYWNNNVNWLAGKMPNGLNLNLFIPFSVSNCTGTIFGRIISRRWSPPFQPSDSNISSFLSLIYWVYTRGCVSAFSKSKEREKR